VAVIGLTQAQERLAGAGRVALGGMLLENRPCTLVRALLRSGAGGLFLTSAPAASWDADVLIGAGRVATVRIPHISLGSLGLAPATRGAARAGSVVFEECDESLLIGGYLAAGHRAALHVLHSLGTNDMVDGNPLVLRRGGLTGVGPLEVDVALLHAPVGDDRGNLVHFGSRWADLLMARAARYVIAQVDRIASVQETARLGVSVPGYLVDDIVPAPFAAHPCGSVGSYVADLAHLVSYRDRVAAGQLGEYLAAWCDVDHDAYLARIPAARREELVRDAG
jgi:glutaconate CoA-transferase subunit A